MSVEQTEELERRAEAIPQMGGRRIGGWLRRFAKETPANTNIVELGCWLGAGTAQLAMGLRERPAGHGVRIHCFDNFHTSPSSAEKANRQGYVDLREGDDTLELVKRTLAPFSNDIHFTKGMLGKTITEWSGGPISLHIDDASKYRDTFIRCLRIFAPSWTPGQTIVVLMDYWLFRQKKNVLPEQKLKSLQFQHDFVQAHAEHFEDIPGFKDNAVRAFRYTKPIDVSKLPDTKEHD
jgi:hypothetical protein